MDTKQETARPYINQELGRLEFQRRVFEEAQDPRNPLLERVKFIAILGSNLDEFFMVRVGGHTAQNPSRLVEFFPDDENPAELMASVRKVALSLMEDVQNYLRTVLMPELDRAGIHVLDYDQLNPEQKAQADAYFREVIFPVLTPLAFDTGHPFPHISNLSLNLAVLVRGQDGRATFCAGQSTSDPALYDPGQAACSGGRDGRPRAAALLPGLDQPGDHCQPAGPVPRFGSAGSSPVPRDAQCRNGAPGG